MEIKLILYLEAIFNNRQNSKLDILYTSIECYPAAKVGGLADVVGALPKYINRSGHSVRVIMPMYDLPWINDHAKTANEVYAGEITILNQKYPYRIVLISEVVLGFELLLVDIPALFYRAGVYADADSNYYRDEAERNTSFDKAVLNWVLSLTEKPDIIHCHDHHTSLIPWMMTHCPEYAELAAIPTVFTIHNERYRGRFTWQKQYLLPAYSSSARGLLDWDGMIDPLASAVKCCWRMTTVSPSYMEELLDADSDLRPLFQNEKGKATGILNGIDSEYWNPKQDPLIEHPLRSKTSTFKRKNKAHLCKLFKLDSTMPLVSFIGRLAIEKGADLLPDTISSVLKKHKNISILILGTGESALESELKALALAHPDRLSVHIMYNERLAHQIYAGSDFLLMPSRVEPCGLNQMYALRYGTIPIVRSTGGLRDTVIDIKYKTGNGIRFDHADGPSISKAITRAVTLYQNSDRHELVVDRAMAADNSWDASADNYVKLYQELKPNR